jgi:hypothetical protein
VTTEDGPGTHAYAIALAPCEVRSPGGGMRILGWPQLEGFPWESLEGEDLAARSEAFLASTSFEPVSPARLRTTLQTLSEMPTDDAGAVSRHLRVGEGPAGLSRCSLRERIVPVGAEVCAFGVFDPRRDGLISGGTSLRLASGQGKRHLAHARHRALSQLATGLLLLLLFGGITLGAAKAFTQPFGEALLEAASRGDTAALRHMLEVGVDPNSRGLGGETALISAASPAVARLLVAYGADVSLVDLTGETALMAAARKADKQLVEVCLAAGADPNATNVDGQRARDLVPPGHPEVLELFD